MTNEVLTAEEFQRKYGKGKKKNKYKVSPKSERTWNGKVYQSKAEMLYRQNLQTWWDNGYLLMIEEQVRFQLGDIAYIADFVVTNKTGVDREAIDVKGMETDRFKLVKRLWPKYGTMPLKIVKKTKTGFRVAKVIMPRKAA